MDQSHFHHDGSFQISLTARNCDTIVEQATLRARQDALQQELIEIDYELNSARSINRLPPEIMSDILLLVGTNLFQSIDQQFGPRPAQYRDARQLWAQVAALCRRWRQVANATPALWQRIDVLQKPEWFELCLSRCSPLLADVYLHDEPLFPLLVSSQERVRRLSAAISGTGVLRSFCFLASPCTGLRTLSLRHPHQTLGRSSFTARIPLTKSDFPDVQSLTISGFWVDIQQSLLTNLRTLVVKQGQRVKYKSMWMDSSRLAKMLHSMPYLEELVLESTFCLRPSDAQATLPRLRTLELTGHSEQATRWFVDHVRAPMVSSVVISFLLTSTSLFVPGGPLFHSLLPNIQVNLPLFFDREAVVVHMEMYSCCLTARTKTSLISLTYSCPRYPVDTAQALTDLVGLFGPSPLKHLHVSSHFCGASAEVWSQVFSQFPDLEHITLAGHGLHSSLWRALQDTPPSSAKEAVCCSRLRTIEVAGVTEGENRDSPILQLAISRVLRHRLERGHKLELLAFPTAFATVGSQDGSFEGCVNEFAQLEDLVGELVVYGSYVAF